LPATLPSSNAIGIAHGVSPVASNGISAAAGIKLRDGGTRGTATSGSIDTHLAERPSRSLWRLSLGHPPCGSKTSSLLAFRPAEPAARWMSRAAARRLGSAVRTPGTINRGSGLGAPRCRFDARSVRKFLGRLPSARGAFGSGLEHSCSKVNGSSTILYRLGSELERFTSILDQWRKFVQFGEPFFSTAGLGTAR